MELVQVVSIIEANNHECQNHEHQRHQNRGRHAYDEPDVVPLSNALIQPLAMVVENSYAFIANRTVLRSLTANP